MDKYPLHRTGATGYNGTGKGTRYERGRFYPLPRSKGKKGEGEKEKRTEEDTGIEGKVSMILLNDISKADSVNGL